MRSEPEECVRAFPPSPVAANIGAHKLNFDIF